MLGQVNYEVTTKRAITPQTTNQKSPNRLKAPGALKRSNLCVFDAYIAKSTSLKQGHVQASMK
jgi:hypothetical protein